MELLRNSEWKHIGRKDQFYCVDDTSWNIVQKIEKHRRFHEPWVDNLYQPDEEIVTYRTLLRNNKIEIVKVRFIELDGSRYTMPLPKKDGPNTYYYCEGDVEHLLFNIVRQSYDMDDELRDLAGQAKIEWRRCGTGDGGVG